MSESIVHVHQLDGCRPTPLAHYLKALGILRLVAEQKDPHARGWWRDDVFCLATELDRKQLEWFFESEYLPTPMTASWLPRSGYSEKSSHRKTREFLNQICDDPSDRFQPFREAKELMVRLAGEAVLSLDDAQAMRSDRFVSAVRRSGSPQLRAWIDSCLVITDDKPSYPAIFGTGGNEGSGSYLANYYVAIAATMIRDLASVKPALWSMFIANDELTKFLKKETFNAGHFGISTGNDCPWSYILTLEGIVTLHVRLSRLTSELLSNRVSGTGSSMAAPFAVGNSCAGYASANKDDSNTRQSGSLVSGRGEQWFPVWDKPSSLVELQELFRTGRVLLGRSQAKRSVDLARSASRAGTSRGIKMFERVGYLQRNGDNHMAIPLGRFEVSQKGNQELLDEVARWLDRLRRIASDKNAPESFDRLHRACEEAVFNCTRTAHGNSFLSLLVAMAKAEDQFVHSPKFAAEKFARPLPPLKSSRWLEMIGGEVDSPEFRLAIALASQRGKLESKEKPSSVRIHWLPLDGNYFAKGEGGLSVGPEQSAIGQDLERALISVMYRRLLGLSRGSGSKFIPLRSPDRNVGATLADIEAFLQFQVDDGKILAIARGLMAVEFHPSWRNLESGDLRREPLGGMATYGLLRLALPTQSLWLPDQSATNVRCNPTVFHRLRSGDLRGAIEIACRGLSAAGLRPRVQYAVGSLRFAQRLAASMAFGVTSSMLTRLALGLTHPEMSREERHEYLVAGESE